MHECNARECSDRTRVYSSVPMHCDKHSGPIPAFPCIVFIICQIGEMEKCAIFRYSTQRDTRPCVSIVSRCLDSQVVDVSRVGRNGVHKELG